MQLKGLVRFFAVALILISIYQLHFTLVVRNHEKKQEEKAQAFVKANFQSADTETKELEFNNIDCRCTQATETSCSAYRCS